MSMTVVEELGAVLGLQIAEGQWAKGNALVTGLKSHVVQLGAAIGGALGIRALKDFVSSFADGADEIGKTAEKLGITTNAVQEYGYSAKLSGVNQEELNQGLLILSKNLGDLKLHGTGPAADGLRLLGLSAADVKGKNLDQTIAILADAFHRMPDGANKAAAAMALAGRSAGNMIPWLSQGSAVVGQQRQEFVGLGAEISGNTIKSATKLREETVRLGAAWQGIKNSVLAPLLPLLNELAEKTMAWVASHRALIAGAIQGAIKTVVEVFKALGDTLAWLMKHKDVAAMLLGVATAIFAWMNPITAVIAALIAIIHYWPQIAEAARLAWDDVVDATEAAAEAVASPFVHAFDAVKSAIKAVIDWIEKQFDRAKKDAQDAIDWIKDKLGIVGNVDNGGAVYHKGTSGRTRADDKVWSHKAIAMMPRYQPTAIGGANQTNTTMVNVNVTTGSGDPHEIGRVAAGAVQQVINQAHEAHRGGRR